MNILQFFSRFLPNKNHYMPVFAQQATYLQQAAGALCQMMDTLAGMKWRLLEKNVDEFLDHINDAAKSVLLYMPDRIDSQIKDLAHYISAEADAIRLMVSFLGDVKGNYAKISLQCDRITELEHAADDAYEEYIGFIFTNEKNAIELMKYKNIAEMLEAATDAAKRVSDSVRKIILRYID